MRLRSFLLAGAVFVILLLTQGAGTIAQDTSAQGRDAFAQNKRLGRGVNVLGYDPIWKDRNQGRFQAEHFRLIREAGFSHVRINLHPFRDCGGTIKDSYFQTLDRAVEQALANKLMVILDFHEFGVYDKAEMASRVRYLDFVTRDVEERGWSWAYWEFDSDFILYDIPGKRWIEPVRGALVPPGTR